MSLELEIFDPNDIKKTKEKLADKTVPCNIYGLINEIINRIEELELKIIKLEEK